MSKGLGKIESKVLDICKRLQAGEFKTMHICYKGGDRWRGSRIIRRGNGSRINDKLENLPETVIDVNEVRMIFRAESPELKEYDDTPASFRRALRRLKEKGYLVYAYDNTGRFISVPLASDTLIIQDRLNGDKSI